jgi:hypothetical protein
MFMALFLEFGKVDPTVGAGDNLLVLTEDRCGTEGLMHAPVSRHDRDALAIPSGADYDGAIARRSRHRPPRRSFGDIGWL